MQKFKRGDKVRVADDLGGPMSHFRSGYDAIVKGSYHDQFGHGDHDEYTLMACDTGSESSWYEEHQLTFLEHVGEEGIDQIAVDRDAREAIESDIDWIFDNWKEIRTSPSGATMDKLMELIGMTNPWGSRGEGITYIMNAQTTLIALDPILVAGDRKTFDEFCGDMRARMAMAR